MKQPKFESRYVRSNKPHRGYFPSGTELVLGIILVILLFAAQPIARMLGF